MRRLDRRADREQEVTPMPELPEVETLCRQLRQKILAARIEGTSVLDGKLGGLEDLKGTRVISVARRGKGIVLELDEGRELALHLRMTGRLLWQEGGEPLPPHSRFILEFSSGRIVLVDPRRFATLAVGSATPRRKTATDALSPECVDALIAKSSRRRCSVKSLLLDQQVIGGIGNIYVCELLFRAGISPCRQAAELSPDEWRRVGEAAAAILSRAIDCRGTSISDWRDLFGRPGEYQEELRVYSREGRPCHRCRGTIRRERLLGRGTWFCPNCQD